MRICTPVLGMGIKEGDLRRKGQRKTVYTHAGAFILEDGELRGRLETVSYGFNSFLEIRYYIIRQ